MQDFRFESPLYLLLLALLPVLQAVLSRIHGSARERLEKFISSSHFPSLVRESGKGGGGRKRILFWLGMSSLVVALARPQANPVIEEREGASLDIYVLLDVSRSMDAEDVAPSRLKKAKHSVQTLMQLLSGDRVGLIAFAGTALVVSPLTGDYEVLDTFLQNVDSGLIQNQGTDINRALEIAEDAMKRGAEKQGKEGPRSNVFVVMSDGEDLEENKTWEAADRIRSQGGIVFTIAFGTEAGAPIPIRSEKGELASYKRDRRGNEVKTVVQTEGLREIARLGGGQFYHSTLEEEEIKDILNRVQGLERSGAPMVRAKVYQEFFPFVLGPAILFLLLSFFSLRFLWNLARDWNPKAKSAALLLLCLLPARAWAGPLSFLWDEKKRAYQKSEELSKEGKNDEAVGALKGLLAENPDSPELNYNVGTYLIEGKKAEEGRTQLGRVAEKESPLRARTLYNIAGSYGAEGKKAESRATYAELVKYLRQKKDLTAEDQDILEKTKRNLSRLADSSQDQQQPQQDQKDQQQSPNQQDQNQQDQQKQGDSKDQKPQDKDQKGQEKKDKDKEGKDQQDKKDESKGDSQEKKDNSDDNKDGDKDGEGKEKDKKEQNGEQQSPPPPLRRGKPQFKEKNDLSEEDAKKMLEALKQRESGLQKKFLKRKENGDKFSDDDAAKDW